MIETIRANPGLTIVTLGPLTNLALALQRDPNRSIRRPLRHHGRQSLL